MRLAGLSVATILFVIFRIAHRPSKLNVGLMAKSQSEPQHNAIAGLRS